MSLGSLSSFAEIFTGLFKRGGGRRPHEKDQDALESSIDFQSPCQDHEARLTIVQITDVYTLDNFASLKTMLKEIREKQNSTETTNKVVSMLTGDFLAPYLLSSVDRGAGMMHAINHTPVDYLTWGNHEADIDHRQNVRHAKNYKGTWINSNMQDHDAMQYQVPYEVIEVQSADGSQTRKIGLIAVLSNDPKLYSHFKDPAFGGATLTDPWETLTKYQKILTEEHGCDLIIPLEHMYVPENTKTCQEFDFPIILSGHDHHRIDQIIHGTRLIKPGMDGVHAAVIEITWPDAAAKEPKIHATFEATDKYEPCRVLKQQTDAAYDVLGPLRNTMLAQILPSFRPLSSKNARGSTCTMGKLICSMLKSSLSQTLVPDKDDAKGMDAVILMGGNIRGNMEYNDDSFFSLETLEMEIKSDEVIGVVEVPGSVLAEGIEATHAGDPIPGWMQYDDGIVEENGKVTMVNGKPLEPDRMYRVATKVKDLTNGQSKPLTVYFKAHPELLPSKGSYINIHSELMGFFARNIFRKLWEATGALIPDPEVVLEEASHPPPSMVEIESRLRLDVLDRDCDGVLTVDDIHIGLRDFLGLKVCDEVKALARQIHDIADVTGNGKVTVDDFEIFCTGMPKELRVHKKWKQAFPAPLSTDNLDAKTMRHLDSQGLLVTETGSETTDVYSTGAGSDSDQPGLTI